MKRPNTSIEAFLRDFPEGDTSPMTFENPVVDDFFEIDGIRNRKFPGEEANPDLAPLYAEERAHIDDRVARLGILKKHPEYEWLGLLAGALQMISVEELFQEDDLEAVTASLRQEQQLAFQLESEKRAHQQQIDKQEQQLERAKQETLRMVRIQPFVTRLNILSGPYTISMISSPQQRGYFATALNYGDYGLVLGENATEQALADFILRYYASMGQSDANFKAQRENLSHDDLRGLAMYALYNRDFFSDDARRGNTFLDDVTRQLETIRAELILEGKTTEAVVSILEKVETYRVGANNSGSDGEFPRLVKEECIVEEGIKRESKRVVDTKAVPDYVGFMSRLFASRDDVVTLNSLLKNIDITAIHSHALNQRIATLYQPSTAAIIDTSREYFREMYFGAKDLLEQFRDTGTSDKERLRELDVVREFLTDFEGLLGDLMTLYNEIVNGYLFPGAMKEYSTSSESVLDATLLANTTVMTPASYEIILASIRDGKFRALFVENGNARDCVMAILKQSSLVIPSLYAAQLLLDLSQYVPDSLVEAQRLQNGGVNVLNTAKKRRIEALTAHQYLSKPINSGVVQLKANIVDKIDEAYNLVQDNCPNLARLPLVGFKSPQACKAGLGGDFARYTAALFVDADNQRPTNYRSVRNANDNIRKRFDLMVRLKKYSYTRCNGGVPPQCYKIFK